MENNYFQRKAPKPMSKKYGRTFHLPGSPGATSDDKIMHNMSPLLAAAEVVITEKMDGENTTIFSEGCHPRSPDARYHPSRDWVKAFAAGISPMLTPNERIVGEYLFAHHSISYDNLPSYFLGFAWIVDDVVQSWDDTLAKFSELGIASVPVLYRGPFSEVKKRHDHRKPRSHNTRGFCGSHFDSLHSDANADQSRQICSPQSCAK